jgi:hypothetical protein
VELIPEEHSFEPAPPSPIGSAILFLSFIHYILFFVKNSHHCIFPVIPDDSLTREPVIHIVESDADIDEPGVSPVEGLVEPSFSIGLTPLSPSGISKPLLVNKSSLITCSPHSTLIAAGQISEPQPLSPIRERSFAESPPSAALLSTGMIHLLFPTLFLYYVFYFFQI